MKTKRSYVVVCLLFVCSMNAFFYSVPVFGAETESKVGLCSRRGMSAKKKRAITIALASIVALTAAGVLFGAGRYMIRENRPQPGADAAAVTVSVDSESENVFFDDRMVWDSKNSKLTIQFCKFTNNCFSNEFSLCTMDDIFAKPAMVTAMRHSQKSSASASADYYKYKVKDFLRVISPYIAEYTINAVACFTDYKCVYFFLDLKNTGEKKTYVWRTAYEESGLYEELKVGTQQSDLSKHPLEFLCLENRPDHLAELMAPTN